MKNNFLYITLIFVLIAAVFIVGNIFVNDNFEREITKISFNDFVWKIEIVNNFKDRAKGLSGREYLEQRTGLLFVFDKKDFHGIWMKEMNFPIDIIWLDEEFRVTDIKSAATPDSYPEVFKPKTKSLYVLEVNSGEVFESEIKIGDKLEAF